MPMIVGVTAEVMVSETGAKVIQVQNVETFQNPGPIQPQTGDLLASVMERLCEDVQTRATDQARQMLKQQP